MSLPLDLEDVVGASVADVARRGFALWSCAAVGWLLVPMAFVLLGMGMSMWEAVASGFSGGFDSVDVDWTAVGLGIAFGFLSPLFSLLFPIYGPYLIWMAWYFFRSEEWSLTTWKWCALGVSACGLVAWMMADFDGWIWAFWVVMVWSGVAGSFLLAMSMLQAHLARRADEHLMAIAAENAQRREEIAAKYGTATAEREFAVGEVDDLAREGGSDEV